GPGRSDGPIPALAGRGLPRDRARVVDGGRGPRGRCAPGASALAEYAGGNERRLRDSARVRDDRRGSEYGVARRMPDARRAAVHQDRRLPRTRPLTPSPRTLSAPDE